MYRCIRCGGLTGETMAEAQAPEVAAQHGVGVCVSPCRWCNDGTLHAPSVCANLEWRDGRFHGEMSRSVDDFIRVHGWSGYHPPLS
jgi:hypothetical protein